MAIKQLPPIFIRIVDHKSQRYPTCGDYVMDPSGCLNIVVSKMGNWKYEAATAIHELIESLDCIDSGVSYETIDEFDKAFEELRSKNPKLIGDVEPGDMLTAPYHASHELATNVEKNYIWGNGLTWKDYEKTVNNL